ncbi:MAG: hypothetical protein WBH44_06705 [Proteocatella sp.]
MSKKKAKEIRPNLNTNKIIEEKTENDNNKKIDEKIKLKRIKMIELLASEDEASLNNEEADKKINNKAGESFEKIGVKFSELLKMTKKTLVNINIKIKKNQENGDAKELFQKNKKIIYAGLLILVVALAGYGAYYSQMPLLKETHNPDIKGVIASYDGASHPFEILSSNRERMVAFKGEPDSKGDGKTLETKFVVYKLDWFGKNRETIIFYDKANHFTRIKLNIGNESAKELVDKLTKNFGSPVEDKDSTIKGGYGIWIRDSIQYKLVHHGNYATIEIKLARYDNTNNLDVGKYPIVIQKLYKLDINKDGKQETMILLGNKKNSLSTNYDKLHLLMWDGKTHLVKMAKDFDGGTYPQVEFKDMDKDGKDEIIVYSDNNEVVRNYDIFKYDGAGLQLTYSGHEEPQEQN